MMRDKLGSIESNRFHSSAIFFIPSVVILCCAVGCQSNSLSHLGVKKIQAASQSTSLSKTTAAHDRPKASVSTNASTASEAASRAAAGLVHPVVYESANPLDEAAEGAEDNAKEETKSDPTKPDAKKSDAKTTDRGKSATGRPSTAGENYVYDSAALPDAIRESENNQSVAPLSLDEVIQSVYQSYPLLAAALQSRQIASGDLVSAAGAFDLKVKAASENGPTGFYQTYRQSVGFAQPTYYGGEVFGGYRIGRGDYQPWYLERETNDGGEFKAGFAVPLAKDRQIDLRRAELWKARIGVQMVQPDIQAQLISYVEEASNAYWDWVAAGQEFSIIDRIMRLAEERTSRIRDQVNKGLIDPPELTDNLRLVAEREAKLAEASRKLQEKAVKLSLYARDIAGEPQIPSADRLAEFPTPEKVSPEQLQTDIQLALQQRPELKVLAMAQRQIEIDCQLARNDLQPALDAVVWGSQDVGEPTSSKRDKSEFEAEASMYLDVPLQRRKARGKLAALQGKSAQLAAKRAFVENKIVAEIQSAYAGLAASYAQIEQAMEAVKHAEDLAQRERLSFEEGASDLLKVTLREQYAVESATKVVDARLTYFHALARYRAAIAIDRL